MSEALKQGQSVGDDESGLPSTLEGVKDGLGQIAVDLKPRLRGWLHTIMAPLMFLAGLSLVVFTPTLGGRVAAAVYLICSILLFGVSATYHRGTWTDDVKSVFRRLDHANIFLFIAGTYTPLAYQLLSGRSRTTLLLVIWGAAALGVLFRVFWLSAPRVLYTGLYVLMGWAAVGWLVPLWQAGGPLIVLLVIAGGLIYTAGAIVYARKRPNPSPEWFGYHEIFHACTVVAAMCHYVAIVLATFAR